MYSLFLTDRVSLVTHYLFVLHSDQTTHWSLLLSHMELCHLLTPLLLFCPLKLFFCSLQSARFLLSSRWAIMTFLFLPSCFIDLVHSRISFDFLHLVYQCLSTHLFRSLIRSLHPFNPSISRINRYNGSFVEIKLSSINITISISSHRSNITCKGEHF